MSFIILFDEYIVPSKKDRFLYKKKKKLNKLFDMKHIYIALFELSQNSREYIQLDLTPKKKHTVGWEWNSAPN